MLFTEGEKIHVAERRGFENDLRRQFVGEVMAVEEGAIRVRGWVSIFDGNTGAFHRHPEERTRIVSLVDARILINIIPTDVDLEQTRHEVNDKGALVVTDGEHFSLAISEFGARR